MAKYICRNCGYIQHKTGYSSGCAFSFWLVCFIFTIFIGLFAPVAWIVVLFEILFMILTRPRKSNECFKCKAKDCIVPIDTPAGKKIYTEFYGEYKEENKFFKNEEEIEQSAEDKKKIEDDETDTEPVDFALKTVKSNKDEMKKLYIWTGITIVFFLILCSCLPLISKLTETKPEKNLRPVRIENTVTPQEKQQMQKKTVKDVETECEVKSKEINNLLSDTTIPNAEQKINNYYSQCAQFDKLDKNKDKHSFLQRYYFLKAADYQKVDDFEKAAIFYKKSAEELKLRQKAPSKWELEMIYGYIADCYYNTWKMEEAAQYYEKAIATGYAMLPFSERLGDCYYNLKDYAKAEKYYRQTIQKVQEYRELLIEQGRYTVEKQQELEGIEQKCQSIIDGTFDQ